MKGILNLIFSKILFVWSYSPLLALTDDTNFGTIDFNFKKDNILDKIKSYRKSFINLMYGNKIIYILTFKDKHFRFYHILKLESYYILTDIEINGICERYVHHINNLNSNNVVIEKESLCYRIENEQRRIDRSLQKINMYATIILTLFPILISVFDFSILFRKNKRIVILLLFICCYCFFNLICYIFNSIKVNHLKQSKFSDLRQSGNHVIKINEQYEYDWQFLRKRADLLVSFVSNIEIWIKYMLIFILILAIYKNI